MIALFESSTGRLPHNYRKTRGDNGSNGIRIIAIPVENLMIIRGSYLHRYADGFDAGCQTTLVLSGESTLESFEKAWKPDQVFDNVGLLLRYLEES